MYILFSIDIIEKYITEISYDEFEESYHAQDKIMRRLEIIAEASKKMPEDIRSQYSDMPWKSIIGLRNIIAHEYDDVNLKEIWQIVTIYLPETMKQLNSYKKH